MKVKIKKLDPDARVPEFAHADDAGMDLYSLKDHLMKPGETVKVETGIAMEFDSDYVALIWDKGSVGIENSIKTLGGVFDSGYRGDYTIGLVNLSKKDYKIGRGDKITQVLFQKIEHPDTIEVEELSDSSRGDGRFGSTGK